MFSKILLVGVTLAAMITSLVTMAANAAMTDDDARKMIEGFTNSFVKAEKAGDAAATAQHFTKDGIRVGPRGIINGQDAILSSYIDIYKTFKEEEDTVDLVKGVDDCAILVSGKWSGTVRGTINIHGYYSFLAVCEGKDWKIKADMYNFAPDGMPPAAPKQ